MTSFVKNWVLPAVAGIALSSLIVALMNHYHVRLRIRQKKISYTRALEGNVEGASKMSEEDLARVRAKFAEERIREEDADWANVTEIRFVFSNWKARQ
jgi:hypothetical protein